MNIAIIGGGACGLMCAALLKDKISKKSIITIIEKEDKVGKKLLQTGNGRGNISNTNMNDNFYNDSFVSNVIKEFTPLDLISFFKKCGVLTFNDQEGRIYPRSETASTILNALRDSYLSSKNVIEKTSTSVYSVEKKNDKFIVKGNNFQEEYDVVIMCIGSKAGTKNYSEKLLHIFNHTSSEVYPSLCPIYVKENVSSLKGLHAKVKATLVMDEAYTSEGEILFKDDSLSGIVMFELSSFYARKKVKKEVFNVYVYLDMLKEYSNVEIYSMLLNLVSNYPNKDCSLLLNGFFPKMIAKYVLDNSNVEYKNRKYKNLTENELKQIAATIKSLRFSVNQDITPTNGQVYSGGVNLDEVSPYLESKLVSNLYFGGEMLNVDGKCGGYNLHFAFACASKIASKLGK